jgi:bacteriorhodopsin
MILDLSAKVGFGFILLTSRAVVEQRAGVGRPEPAA